MKRFLFLLLFPLSISAADFTGSDYSEAMRMAVKFFGAQRCGNTHNWMLYDNTKTDDVCHTKDAYQGHDVSGGWHDCGDHIKVATTMGYAAICLLTAYDLWPKAFEDHHDTAYTEKTNNIPDILDEAKVATDYFMKCFIGGNTFVYYVGNDQDHERWVTSSFQSTLGTNFGGDPRPTAVTTSLGGAQLADYASALALMSMHYPDPAYAKKCKDAAIEMYAFAKAHPSNINIPTFYSSPNSETSDELSLCAILMYRLTKEEFYKTDAFGYLKNKWEANSPLAWDTKADIAYYYLVKEDPAADNGSGGTYKSFLKKDVQSAITGSDQYGIPWKFMKSTWGTNKLASGTAFSAALYAKLIQDNVIKPIDGLSADSALHHCKRVVDHMLGKNSFNHPFLHQCSAQYFHWES